MRLAKRTATAFSGHLSILAPRRRQVVKQHMQYYRKSAIYPKLSLE